MSSIGYSQYRGYRVETRATRGVSSYSAAFTFESLTASVADRTTRMCDGEFASPDQAHAAATRTAQKLIDMLLDEVLGFNPNGTTK